MRRLRLFIVGAVLLSAAAITVGLVYHARGARLETVVTPRTPLTRAECEAEVTGFGGGPGLQLCRSGTGRAWYRAVVRNVGHRGAWVSQCFATGRDQNGHVVPGAEVFEIPMWITSTGIGARPHLDPGRSATLDWFAPVSGRIPHYTATCSLIVYSQPPI